VSAFGVAGMHTTLKVSGRFQVFLTPGVILMRLPTLNGDSKLSAATDWGFSFSLFDVRLPPLRRVSTVHFNMARVWMAGSDAMQMPGDLYIAGLSMTFKQR